VDWTALTALCAAVAFGVGAATNWSTSPARPSSRRPSPDSRSPRRPSQWTPRHSERRSSSAVPWCWPHRCSARPDGAW